MSQLDQMQRKQAERIAEFEALGFKARRGAHLGTIEFTAGDAAKLLAALNARRRTGRLFSKPAEPEPTSD